jgi:CubicO group peptidase (beta-lactamase class C family)
MKISSPVALMLPVFILMITYTGYGQKNKAAEIDSMIRRANRLGVFNGNVLVADRNKIIYRSSIGKADASGKTKLTADYRFHIGSIAKEFNAVGIMLLKEEGKLNLDDKVSKYIPELPAWANKITMLNLLQYTSGLPNIKWKTVKSDADVMNELKKLDTLLFEPGTNYNYNNCNVFLQRHIIGRITGMPFNEFVKQRLLIPCKMDHSVLDPTYTDKLVARCFNNDGVQDSLESSMTGWTAVTLEDFYKWDKALAAYRLISPASTRTILYPSAPNRQSGLGGGGMKGDSIIRHAHDGTSKNYQALLVSEPPKGRVVILLTNNMQNNLYEFDRAIQAILDGKPYTQPKRSALVFFRNSLDSMSSRQVIDRYKELSMTMNAEYGFDNESVLNSIGYFFLGKGRFEDAIAVFEYNTKLFPSSGNVFDSLGEAYYKKGDRQNALLNYKSALALDPGNTTAQRIIEELSK